MEDLRFDTLESTLTVKVEGDRPTWNSRVSMGHVLFYAQDVSLEWDSSLPEGQKWMAEFIKLARMATSGKLVVAGTMDTEGPFNAHYIITILPGRVDVRKLTVRDSVTSNGERMLVAEPAQYTLSALSGEDEGENENDADKWCQCQQCKTWFIPTPYDVTPTCPICGSG